MTYFDETSILIVINSLSNFIKVGFNIHVVKQSYLKWFNDNFFVDAMLTSFNMFEITLIKYIYEEWWICKYRPDIFYSFIFLLYNQRLNLLSSVQRNYI
jgi:hypothetical protein